MFSKADFYKAREVESRHCGACIVIHFILFSSFVQRNFLCERRDACSAKTLCSHPNLHAARHRQRHWARTAHRFPEGGPICLQTKQGNRYTKGYHWIEKYLVKLSCILGVLLLECFLACYYKYNACTLCCWKKCVLTFSPHLD